MRIVCDLWICLRLLAICMRSVCDYLRSVSDIANRSQMLRLRQHLRFVCDLFATICDLFASTCDLYAICLRCCCEPKGILIVYEQMYVCCIADVLIYRTSTATRVSSPTSSPLSQDRLSPRTSCLISRERLRPLLDWDRAGMV